MVVLILVLKVLGWGLLALLVSLLLSYAMGGNYRRNRPKQKAEERPDRPKAA
jgi:hypothetical protein